MKFYFVTCATTFLQFWPSWRLETFSSFYRQWWHRFRMNAFLHTQGCRNLKRRQGGYTGLKPLSPSSNLWNQVPMLGVPTFKKNSSDLAGWNIFRTIFHKDFKNVNFINVGHTPSTHNFCPRSPRTGSASGYVGRVGASTGFVWSKN